MTTQRANRRHSLAVAAAAALALAPAAPALGQSIVPTQELEKAGWTLITASDDTYVFMKPAERSASGVRRVWTAYDSERVRDRQGFAFRSVESLGEFDCRRHVSRIVEERFHAQAALKGRTWQQPNFTPTAWAAPEPGSVGAIRMAFACKALSET